MNYRILSGLAAAAVFLIMAGAASADGTFEGRKKCFNCHKGEGEAWEKTLHGKAMESLKPSRGKK